MTKASTRLVLVGACLGLVSAQEIVFCLDGKPVGGDEGPSGLCPPENPPEAMFLPNPDDCTSYFECDDGVAELQCCPAGLYYDEVMKNCGDNQHVACGNRPVPTPVPTIPPTTTMPPTTAPITTTLPPVIEETCSSLNVTEELFFPDESDCHRYIFCYVDAAGNVQIETVACPGEDVFDYVENMCVNPAFFPCEYP